MPAIYIVEPRSRKRDWEFYYDPARELAFIMLKAYSDTQQTGFNVPPDHGKPVTSIDFAGDSPLWLDD